MISFDRRTVMKNDVNTQLDEILKRSEKIKRDKAYNIMAVRTALTAVMGIAVMVLAVIFMPDFSEDASVYDTSRYGSLIITAPYLGYVIIGILAFILGVLVTVFAVKLRKLDEYRKEL